MPSLVREIKDGGSGVMTPPPGRSCDWLKQHAFGNRSTTKRVCPSGEILLIRETTVTTATPLPNGQCEMKVTTLVLTIHTGRSCDPATYHEKVGGDADEEFTALEAEIQIEEAEKKKKK
jgi:hypothetical protein